MIIKKVGHKANFAIVDKTAFEDPDLSAEAKGVYGYCIVKPADWQITKSDVMKNCRVGREKFGRIMKELQSAGYASLKNHRDKAGKVKGREWVIFETPSLNDNRNNENPSFGATETLENRKSVKPKVGKTDRRETRLSNKDTEELSTNKEISTNKELKRDFFDWFLKEWNLNKASFRLENAWMKLTEQEKGEIQSHLPKYLKASGTYAGKPENYLTAKKWTEEIYIPTNGKAKSNDAPKQRYF